MSKEEKNNRLKKLLQISPIARIDHRHLIGPDGQHAVFKNMSRDERRKFKRAGRIIGEKYKRILMEFAESGSGFPVNVALRQFAKEYTHRYATSGVYNQPLNFNYIEPFLNIELIPNSEAPYTALTEEVDHLFNLSDFFEFVTTPENLFDATSLLEIQENRTYHFTTNGDILDLTFLDGKNSEYVISGFSMIRRGRSLHWYLLGAELLTEKDWNLRCENQSQPDIQDIPASKRPFLKESLEKKQFGGNPIILEGIKFSQKMIIAGEFDLKLKKHISRCQMLETEHSFYNYCDDPEILKDLTQTHGEKVVEGFKHQMKSAAVIWNLADSFFQLPQYFSHKIIIQKELFVNGGKPIEKQLKGGKGLRANYKVVSSIDIKTKANKEPIRELLLPHYQVETEGHWRRIESDQTGKDRDGNEIKGKTWIVGPRKWIFETEQEKTVFVKESISKARLKIAEYQKAADELKSLKAQPNQNEKGQELYIMRCPAMSEHIFKVGWTAGKSIERAEQLSGATGVPKAFVVVKIWKHQDAEKLEKEIHMMLEPYSINSRREFFNVKFEKIVNVIETVLARATNC